MIDDIDALKSSLWYDGAKVEIAQFPTSASFASSLRSNSLFTWVLIRVSIASIAGYPYFKMKQNQ